jgi:hypothetical protein
VEVRDAVTNAVLTTQPASGFHNGQYWQWSVRGHVTVRLVSIAGFNAVVSALFFDP